MNGTFGGDLHELRVLFCGQRPCQFHFNIDSINHAVLRVALLTIACVNARVPQGNRDIFQWQMISTRVKADCHRGADAKAREQVIVWIRPGIATAGAHRFVRDKVMLTRSDLLLKILRAAAHDDVRCLFSGLCSHNPKSRTQDARERVAVPPDEKDQ
jgi:hypothetical protein